MTKTKTIILTLFINIVIFPLLIVTSLSVSNKIYYNILGKTGNNDLLIFGNHGNNDFFILVFILLNIITLFFVYFLTKRQESSVVNEDNIRETKIKNLAYSFFTIITTVVISIILFRVFFLIVFTFART